MPRTDPEPQGQGSVFRQGMLITPEKGDCGHRRRGAAELGRNRFPLISEVRRVLHTPSGDRQLPWPRGSRPSDQQQKRYCFLAVMRPQQQTGAPSVEQNHVKEVAEAPPGSTGHIKVLAYLAQQNPRLERGPHCCGKR